jgi:predicted RNA-binding Zn-ribbon protein involved in translation (DUF1610 family)
MQHYESIPLQEGFTHPKCPKCGTRMFLTRIEPDRPAYDRRTFECIECGSDVVEVVKYNSANPR